MKFYKQTLSIKFVSTLAVTIFFTCTSNQVLATKRDIREFGIVIFPEEKCIEEAKKLNFVAQKHLSNLKNVKNHWHVTLYHGAYENNDIDKIYSKLKELQLRPFNIKFNKVYATADRWIDLGVEKTEYIQNLHRSIVYLFKPYHKRPLARSEDAYEKMTIDQRKQVNDYGVSGVLSLYNPHMTLFYVYPPSSNLQQTATKLAKNFKGNLVCKASKIVLGELEYNGNLTTIIHTINIPE